ncbi:hypothetical protein [uncultured Methanofollis sp.]|uniref:hypothetical protein n=1 Tax=uncultured Methanofollis sp. TaxID=262500 RepID=UPI00262FA3C1|nr:hypothetical protein [uncultured Methanofollis sp.]
MRVASFMIAAALACLVLTCGCTGGEATVTLDTDAGTVTGHNDTARTVEYQVQVTATNTGTAKARDVEVAVTAQQVSPGDDWTARIAGSDLQTGKIAFGTIMPGESVTKTVTVTLTGTPDSYQALKAGTGIEVVPSLSHLSSVPLL